MIDNELTDYLVALHEDETNSDLEQCTKELRQFANAAGWPAVVVSQISLIAPDGTYKVYYPPSIKEEYMLLEYGTQYVPARPVERPFLKTLKG